MKLIKIDDENIKLMNFDEVVEQYKGLVYKLVRKWVNAYDFDDLYQEALIGLWGAYQNYDIEKGASFSSMAYQSVSWELGKHHNIMKAKKRNIPSVSLNTLVADGDTELEDLLGEDETFTDKIADENILEKILKNMSKEQRKILELHVMGYNQGEIAEMYNTTKQNISLKLKKIFDKARTIYIKSQLEVS